MTDTAPLFEYSPKTSHLTAGVTDAQIQIKVENKTADRRDVDLVFRLPETKFGTTVTPGVDRDDLWSINRSGAGVYVASQRKAFKLGVAVGFTFDHIHPQGQSGNRLTLAVEERVDGELIGTVTLDVELVDAGASVDAFWAQRIQIRPDEGATLSWRTARAQTVSLRWGSTTREGLPAQVPDDTQGIKPMVMPSPPVGVDEITYTLRATDARGKSTERSVTVSVANVKAKLWADPAWVKPGQKTTLRWKTSNAVKATVDGQLVPDDQLESGARTVNAGPDAVYTLAAFGEGEGNVATGLVKVSPGKMQIISFTAADESVEAGGTVRLSWLTTSASQVYIWPGPGIVAGAGWADVRLIATTTFTLHATQGTAMGRPLTKDVRVAVKSYNASWTSPRPAWCLEVKGAIPYESRIREGAIVRTFEGEDPVGDGVWIVDSFDPQTRRITMQGPTPPLRPMTVKITVDPVHDWLRYDLLEQKAWTDAASRTTPVLFSELRPAQRAWVEVRVRNRGALAWEKQGAGRVELVTSPQGRPSLFADPTWPEGRLDRVAPLAEAKVVPGAEGTFGFWITVPVRVAPGPYLETFALARPQFVDQEPINFYSVIS